MSRRNHASSVLSLRHVPFIFVHAISSDRIVGVNFIPVASVRPGHLEGAKAQTSNNAKDIVMMRVESYGDLSGRRAVQRLSPVGVSEGVGGDRLDDLPRRAQLFDASGVRIRDEGVAVGKALNISQRIRVGVARGGIALHFVGGEAAPLAQ